MWIRQLFIENFRGIRQTTVELSERQTVLVGANGAGKSTIVEAMALLFGRDRLVRSLTEHDFFGSNPSAGDRIRLVATVTGFKPNSPSAHTQWFSAHRGIEKWRNHASGALMPEQQSTADELCVQIAFCARFDRSDLEVETVRYFHDDDSIRDPFDEDVVQPVPRQLIADFGFFLVPAHRTWDKLVSFNSELFRRILDSTGTLVAVEVLAERDRLRQDEHRVDLQGALKAVREGIDQQLKQLLPGDPGLELRLTGTDTESLLQALVPHYRYANSISLPASRHGSGLLSLQTALLVLQIAERRRKTNQNVLIAVEEPELHMPPGVQAHILHRLRNCSNQLVCTTHSPRVGAVCPAVDIRLVNTSGGTCGPVTPLLGAPLPDTAKNGIRKLFYENRQSFVEAIMHRFVLVPEGRTDAEWLRLLSMCAITDQDLTAATDPLPFGTLFGVVPTHDACIVDTVDRINQIRLGGVALVDGDGAGNDYVKDLLKAVRPPDHILQWPDTWLMEDVIGWILGQEEDLAKQIQAEWPGAPGTISEIVLWLKTPTKQGGAKSDFLAYEAVAGAILTSATAKGRARTLLGAFMLLADHPDLSGSLQKDKNRSTAKTSLWRFVL